MRTDYEQITRDVVSLIPMNVETALSVEAVAKNTGHSESSIWYVKPFIEHVGALKTRFEWDGKGRVAYWIRTKSEDEVMRLLKEEGLDSFSHSARKRVALAVTPRKRASQEVDTAHPSKKNVLLDFFKKSADTGGRVRGVSWYDAQMAVGDGVGLHAIFHLCHSLRRDGAIRFSQLPEKLSSAAEARVMQILEIDVTPQRRNGKAVPEQQALMPELEEDYPAVVTGTQTRNHVDEALVIETQTYRSYLTTPGMPETPVADGIERRLTALETARDALVDVGEDALQELVQSSIDAFSPAEQELVRVVRWLRTKATHLVQYEEVPKERVDQPSAH